MSEIDDTEIPRKLVQQLSSVAATASSSERMFMEQMAMRQREPNASETTVDELEKLGVDRSQAIAFLKKLEQLGCGRFVEGRHGKKSRLAWGAYGAIAISKAFLSTPGHSTTEKTVDELADDSAFNRHTEILGSARMHRHVFLLRPDLTIAFELPLDLTSEEANRLAEFVRAIPF